MKKESGLSYDYRIDRYMICALEKRQNKVPRASGELFSFEVSTFSFQKLLSFFLVCSAVFWKMIASKRTDSSAL